MRFAIIDGKPFLITSGRAYPVEIKNGVIHADLEKAFDTDYIGRYSYEEIVAKLGPVCSSIEEEQKEPEKAPVKRTRKKAE